MRRVALVTLTALVALSAAATAQERDDMLELDLYLEWERVSDPQISPDGRQIVYSRRWVDKMKDRWTSSLWIMDADGGRNRFLTEGSSPRWSPDGTRLAFVEEADP
jgi:dipeptidyl aminopeptidase/acylaminoacyl peptidase